MLKSLTEKILAAPLLNAESDPEFQRDALRVVQPNAFSIRPWGRPREIWCIDDRAEERIRILPLYDPLSAIDRAIIIVFAANGFRHPGVREMLPSVISINEALESAETVLFVKAEAACAMHWTNILTSAFKCNTRILFDSHAVDCVAAK